MELKLEEMIHCRFFNRTCFGPLGHQQRFLLPVYALYLVYDDILYYYTITIKLEPNIERKKVTRTGR
jgi:hypothetical protein